MSKKYYFTFVIIQEALPQKGGTGCVEEDFPARFCVNETGFAYEKGFKLTVIYIHK